MELLTPFHTVRVVLMVYTDLETTQHFFFHHNKGCVQSAGESTEEEGTQERGDPPQDGSAARFWGDERKARSSHRGHQLSGQRDKGLQQGCLHMGQDVRLRAVGALC